MPKLVALCSGWVSRGMFRHRLRCGKARVSPNSPSTFRQLVSTQRAGNTRAHTAAAGCSVQQTPETTLSPLPSQCPGLSMGRDYFWCFLICPTLLAGFLFLFDPPALEEAPAFKAGCSCPGRCNAPPPASAEAPTAGAARQLGRLLLQPPVALPALPRREATASAPACEPAFAG